MGDDQLALALLSGLLGAAAVPFVQFLYRRATRPILSVEFGPRISGCAANIYGPTLRRDLRLHIRNIGKAEAKSVRVVIERMRYVATDPLMQKDIPDEIVDLGTSWDQSTYASSIGVGGHRYSGFAAAREDEAGVQLVLCEHVGASSLAPTQCSPGSYEAEIFTWADNADPVRARIRWSWDGTVAGLMPVSCKQLTEPSRSFLAQPL